MEKPLALLISLLAGVAALPSLIRPPSLPPPTFLPPPSPNVLLWLDGLDRYLGRRVIKQKYVGASYVPQRDYSKQSCYHAFVPDPEYFTYCNAERCTFPNGQYCIHDTKQCYDPDGRIILNSDGQSVTDYDQYYSLQWKLCLDKEGTPLSAPGEKPYAERYKPECVYKITDPGYQGYDFLVKCDQYRCIFPTGTIFDMQTKLYHFGMTWGDRIYTTAKTPMSFDLASIDWTCRDIKAIKGFRSEFLCQGFAEREPLAADQKSEMEPGACEICYENKKLIHKNCVYTYDAKGQRLARRLPAFQEEFKKWFNELELLRGSFISTDAPDQKLITPLTDLKLQFLTIPLSDNIQQKLSKVIERFLGDREIKNFTRNQTIQELKKLKTDINAIIQSGK